MKNTRLLQVLTVLAFLGVLDAGYLTYEHFADTLPACSTSIFADCGKVLKSSYSKIYGVPLALLGLFDYFTLLLFFLLISKKKVRIFSYLVLFQSFAGFLFSIYLVYLQIFIIGSICLYCMISALISTAIFFLSQKYFENERREITISLTSYVYKNILRPLFFLTDSEKIHDTLIFLGKMGGNSKIAKKSFAYLFDYQHKGLSKKAAGIFFKNPIGLAAGFDYNANLTQFLPSLGFGFATIGTVTNLPYEGNPAPRLGRLPKSRSLLVNKGFKSAGADEVSRKLSGLNFDIPIGVSIGRSNSPTLKTQKDSVKDIVSAFKKFEEAKVKNSFYELNISCPNLIHAGNITFYPPENLEELLLEIDKLKLKKPIFIKMPIDKTDKEVRAILSVISKHTPAGVIFGNLQKDRKDPAFVKDEIMQFKDKMGHFSGKPTYKRSNELIALARKNYKDRFVIIGCGGVFSAKDAQEKFTQGADLVQLITGLIFQGPQLPSEININLASSK